MHKYVNCLLALSICFGLLQPSKNLQSSVPDVAQQRSGTVQPPPLCQPITNSKQPPNRLEFAEKMATLKPGMLASEVIKILGQPDDIKTQNDPGGVRLNKTKEIWGYGTNGHLTFPTLGQVYINEKDEVQYLSGHQGAPPKTTLFTEQELLCILRILSEVPSYGQGNFNPRPLIRAINTLQPRGKQKALAAINEYLRVTSSFFPDESRGGIFFVLRLLFEVPESPGYMPTMHIGAWSPAPPDDPKKFPHYPLVLQGDIPFNVTQGYMLAGSPERPEQHVAYFQKHGILRKRLLQPATQPWQAMEQLVTTYSDFPLERKHLVGQVVRLLDSVYEIQDDEKWVYNSELSSRQYLHAQTTIPFLLLQWDRRSNCYTFTDGRVRSPVSQPQYRREIWHPDESDSKFEVIIERGAKHIVHIAVSRSYLANSEWDGGILRVYEPSSPENHLVKFDLEKLDANSGWSSSSSFLFEAGKSLVIELKGQRKTLVSPAYIP